MEKWYNNIMKDVIDRIDTSDEHTCAWLIKHLGEEVNACSKPGREASLAFYTQELQKAIEWRTQLEKAGKYLRPIKSLEEDEYIILWT